MKLTLAVLVLSIPVHSVSAVSISEIMYDLEGSDSGREWVELYNEGDDVDIALWRFFEGDTNHKLTIIQGATVLSAGGYAIIADNAETFLADHPNYNGVLFDSSFSLSNTGEYIAIRNEESLDVDSVSYSSELGANGDGNSLHFKGAMVSVSMPTPGGPSSQTVVQPKPAPTTDSNNADTEVSKDAPILPKDTKKISADAGIDRTVLVGNDTLFVAKAFGHEGEPLDTAEYLWSFGDGSIERGHQTLHTYVLPGDYVVQLTVTSGKYSDTDRIYVTANVPNISVSEIKSGQAGYISITNHASDEIDVSRWIIRSGGRQFQFPQGTIIMARTTVPFPATVTGLLGEDPTLLYFPNGTLMPVSITENEKEDNTDSLHTEEIAPSNEQNMHQESAPTVDQSLINTPKEADGELRSAQTAVDENAVPADERDLGILKWVTMLVALVVTGAVGAVIVRAQQQLDDQDEVSRIAQEIEIIE